MDLAKIKKAVKDNPNAEFIYSGYRGRQAHSNYSLVVNVVSTEKYTYYEFPGYSGHTLTPESVKDILATRGTGRGHDYYLLVKVLPVINTADEYYTMVSPRAIAGLYDLVKDRWTKEQLLEQKLKELREKQLEIVRAETSVINVKEQLVVKELNKYLKELGVTDDELDQFRLRTEIKVEFAKKTYPELGELSDQFTADLDNWEVKIEHSTRDLNVKHIHTFIELVETLRQSNLELAQELEREKRKNASN